MQNYIGKVDTYVGSRVYLKNAIVGIKVRFNTIVFFSVKLHINFYLFQMLVALDVGER